MADTYKVLSQAQGYTLNTDGQTVQSMEIVFEAEPAGVQSRITVPMAEYTTEHVQQLLESAAETINAVHSL